MLYPRCPIYIGIQQDIAPMSILDGSGSTLRPSTHGGWILAKGQHIAYVDHIGNKQVGGTWYRVYEIRTIYGDIRRVWRFFKTRPGVTGPFHLGNAPAALLQLLRELNGEARQGVTSVIAGDNVPYLDTLRYQEGADPSGDDDEIITV